MIAGFVILIAIVLLGTMVMARRAGRTGRTASVAQIIRINGIVLAVVAAMIGAGWYGVRAYQYDQCRQRAGRAEGSRAQSLQLYKTIDFLTGHPEYTESPVLPGLPSLVDALDVNLPILSSADCHHP